jgi:hypothetical protein
MSAIGTQDVAPYSGSLAFLCTFVTRRPTQWVISPADHRPRYCSLRIRNASFETACACAWAAHADPARQGRPGRREAHQALTGSPPDPSFRPVLNVLKGGRIAPARLAADIAAEIVAHTPPQPALGLPHQRRRPPLSGHAARLRAAD